MKLVYMGVSATGYSTYVVLKVNRLELSFTSKSGSVDVQGQMEDGINGSETNKQTNILQVT